MEQSTGEAFYSQERETITTEMPRIAEVPENGNGLPHRVVGAPLSMGSGAAAPPPQSSPEPKRLSSVPPYSPAPAPAPAAAPSSGRSLTSSTAAQAPAGPVTGLLRAVGLVRAAIPIMQRLIPLLDRDIVTTVTNILAPPPPPPAPAPPVDLAPLESTLTELKSQHRELREQFVEQNSSLKRVEDHLEMVREATDRNTLEQQELLEDLKTVGNKVNLVAVIAIGLLGISVLLNLLLYMHIQRVLP